MFNGQSWINFQNRVVVVIHWIFVHTKKRSRLMASIFREKCNSSGFFSLNQTKKKRLHRIFLLFFIVLNLKMTYVFLKRKQDSPGKHTSSKFSKWMMLAFQLNLINEEEPPNRNESRTTCLCFSIGRNVVISDGNEYAIRILAWLHHGFGVIAFFVVFLLAKCDFSVQKFRLCTALIFKLACWVFFSMYNYRHSRQTREKSQDML